MKRILASGIALATFASVSVASASGLPLNKADADIMITSLRNSAYMAQNDICKKDKAIIKASFKELYDVNMEILKTWIAETSKTRVITPAERKELLEVQAILQLEARFPKRPSWNACDTVASSLDQATWYWVDNFQKMADAVNSEFADAPKVLGKDGLRAFESFVLSGSVAVVRSSETKTLAKSLASHEGFVAVKTDASWKTVSWTVYFPAKEINEKKATINGFKLKNVTSDMLARIYMSMAPGMPNRPANVAPVRKIGDLYYRYKDFRK